MVNTWIKPRENAFDDPEDLEAAYWAGFLAADGWISVRPNRKQLLLGVALKPGDAEHLCKLRTFLDVEVKPIYVEKTKNTLSVTSTPLCAALTKVWNVTPRKAHTYSPPKHRKHTMLSFYRGLFDGDGSISGRTRPSLRRMRFPRAQLTIAGSIFTIKALHSFFKVGVVDEKQRAWRVSKYLEVKPIMDALYLGSSSATRLQRKYTTWHDIRAQERIVK